MKIAWLVMEHYFDNPSEPFGQVLLDHTPEPGEVLPLYWHDGRKAYDVQILDVDPAQLTIHARARK